MEVMQVLRVLLRRLPLVLIPVIIVALVALPDLLADVLPGQPDVQGGFVTVLRYTAAQVLDAIPERDGDYQDVWLASELTVNAFTEWVKSSEFALEVNELLLQQGEDVNTRGAFASDNERSVGVIEIRWGDEQTLRRIANATVEVLQTRSGDYFPQLGDVPARVALLDTPTISPAPPPLTNRLRPLLQLGVALLAGITLAFLAEYFDPVLRRREQVEGLNLPVVARIPRE
jgi:capsular polysaccharide biosynthesis protein